MDKVQAEEFLANLDIDERHDLLMYLAEIYGYRITNEEGKDITYFLASDYNIWIKDNK